MEKLQISPSHNTKKNPKKSLTQIKRNHTHGMCEWKSKTRIEQLWSALNHLCAHSLESLKPRNENNNLPSKSETLFCEGYLWHRFGPILSAKSAKPNPSPSHTIKATYSGQNLPKGGY